MVPGNGFYDLFTSTLFYPYGKKTYFHYFALPVH